VRRIAVAAAFLATGLGLSGCESPAAEGSSTSEIGAPLSGTVTVFAAASLTETFDTVAQLFEAANPGIDVVLNLGRSRTLAEQIVQGAPADVFAAADAETMATVADASLTTDHTVFVTNTLEIAVPAR
jgi:molybdate transport system substrate-binding protein